MCKTKEKLRDEVGKVSKTDQDLTQMSRDVVAKVLAPTRLFPKSLAKNSANLGSFCDIFLTIKARDIIQTVLEGI